MLEAGLQPDNAFITLTYAVEPENGSLNPAHLRAFMKALRKRIEPHRIRFYGVGEYGDKSERPHYHVALFDYPTCRQPGRRKGDCTCKPCSTIRRAWVDEKSQPRGFIINLPLEIGSARYIARYVVKKMTRTDDPRLRNRHPEFSRQSNRPGIGFGVLSKLAEQITRYNLLDAQGDVPVTLRWGTQQMPLGRYLRKQLRIKLGLNPRSPHANSPEASFKHFHSEENAEMRAVQKAALSDKKNPSLKAHILAASKTARDQIERRNQLFNRQKGSAL